MKSLVTATGTLVLMLTLGATRSQAWAAYAVQSAAGCTAHPTLAAAIGSGASTIFVSNTNVEATFTVIPRDLVLRSAVNLCNAGGAGVIELIAGGATRVLEVAAGTALDKLELTLRGVTVSGGNITGDGGTIYLHTDSTLLVRGGGRVEGGIATGRGGCIYADHARVIMDPGTSVGACVAGTDGGGLAIAGVHTPGAAHKLYSIDDNIAVAGNGGGVWIESAPVCMFDATGNSAALDGGAAFVTSSPTTSAWLGAFDVQELNVAGRDGGGIFVTGSQSSVDAASRLTLNTASRDGAGIRASDAALVYLNPGARLVANNAKGDGGGVHASALARIVVNEVGNTTAIGDGEIGHGDCGDAIGSVVIDNNRAGFDAAGLEVSPVRDGGGVFLSSATLDGTNVTAANPFTISNNVASDSGGGIAAFTAATVDVLHTDIVSNAASHGDGGGLLARSASVAKLGHASFEANSAAAGGGGGSGIVGATAIFDDVSFLGNSAVIGGGLGANSAATVTITTADLTSNTALSGGGISVSASSTLTMLRGTIASNTADLGGGVAAISATAIFGDEPPACPSGGACVKLSGNVATGLLGRGGAVALVGANTRVEIRRARIVDNLADQGGATWMDRTDHTLYLHNSAILDNHGNNGLVSAIAAQAGTLAMLDNTIAHNDIGIGLLPPIAATMRDSLVIQNVIDIVGLNLGASMTGDCNGVQLALTQAAIVGADNVVTNAGTASVSAITGAPINTADIVDECANGLLPRDLRGFGRPVGARYDRGAYEVQ